MDDFLFVGAPLNSDNDPSRYYQKNGKVYIYSTKNFDETQTILNTNLTGDYYEDAKFGSSLSATDNFMFASVDVDKDDSGTTFLGGGVYVYKRNGQTWELQQKIYPEKNIEDFYQNRASLVQAGLASNGSELIIGSLSASGVIPVAQAYVYREGMWTFEEAWISTQNVQNYNNFNNIAFDGSYALVRDGGDTKYAENMVRVFQHDNGAWSETATLWGPDGSTWNTPSSRSEFGWGTTINNGIAVIGDIHDPTRGKGAGAAYVFEIGDTAYDITIFDGITCPSETELDPIPADYSKFKSFINECLEEAPVDGECETWANASKAIWPFGIGGMNYGTMPNWDTSLVTNMLMAFSMKNNFNGDISRWNTTSVTTMYMMFRDCYAFDQDISGWKGPAATTPQYAMLRDADAFLAKYICTSGSDGPASSCVPK